MAPEQRALGRSGLSTTPLMLGGNVFGWTCDAPASFAVLDAFLAGGGRLIDTADMYSNWIPGLAGGESETMIGDWQHSRRCRDRILIATKIGRGHPPFNGLSAKTIVAGVEESLRRLRTDFIDIYFAHLDDRDTPLDETMSAFDVLIRDGKVRALGASHYDAARLAEAEAMCAVNRWARYEVVQPRYNLMVRDEFEGALQAHCLARDIGVVPFYGLASGFLSGKYRRVEDLEGRPRGPEVARYLTDGGFRVLDALDVVAADTDMTPAQVAIAWLIAQPGVTAPIASATSVAQAEALIAAMTLRLTADQIDLLNRTGAGK